jgi:quercetin dioxygenase-like cupin family protein
MGGMVRWLWVTPLWFSCVFLSCAVVSCTAAQVQPPLSALEREQAIERGRELERSAPELDARPTGGSYRLLHVTKSAGARLHPDVAVSILVLSGNVRLATERGERVLEPGQSVHVPRGMPYELESQDEQGSSVYLLFAPAEPSPEAEPPDRLSLSDARAP